MNIWDQFWPAAARIQQGSSYPQLGASVPIAQYFFTSRAAVYAATTLARSTFSGLLGDRYQGEPVPGHAVLFKAEVLVFLWLKMAGYSEKVGYLVVKLLYGS
jgi:hypothetical protein